MRVTLHDGYLSNRESYQVLEVVCDLNIDTASRAQIKLHSNNRPALRDQIHIRLEFEIELVIFPRLGFFFTLLCSSRSLLIYSTNGLRVSNYL